MIDLLVLVLVTMVWGWTFVMVKDAIAIYPLSAFLGLRFLLASAVLALLLLRLPKRRALAQGAVVGAAVACGYLGQTQGLETIGAGTVGLLTGLFVVFTPIFERIGMGRRLSRLTMIAILVAVVGTALLTSTGSSGFQFGDLLVILSAMAFAAQIVLLSAWSRTGNAMELALVQMLVCAVVFIGLAGATDAKDWPPPQSVLPAVAVTGVLASALAFWAQTWVQQRMAASRAALIMALEPAFALFFSLTLTGQRLGLLQALGATLLLIAVVGHEALARLAPATGPSVGA